MENSVFKMENHQVIGYKGHQAVKLCLDQTYPLENRVVLTIWIDLSAWRELKMMKSFNWCHSILHTNGSKTDDGLNCNNTTLHTMPSRTCKHSNMWTSGPYCILLHQFEVPVWWTNIQIHWRNTQKITHLKIHNRNNKATPEKK